MARILLILLAALFLGIVVVTPVAAIFHRAFADGWVAYVAAIVDPETVAAIRLTVIATLIVLPINLVFGVAGAWLIARYRFFGRRALLVLLNDLREGALRGL